MENNFNKHLGNKLKIRRLALVLTQTKLAKAINAKIKIENFKSINIFEIFWILSIFMFVC